MNRPGLNPPPLAWACAALTLAALGLGGCSPTTTSSSSTQGAAIENGLAEFAETVIEADLGALSAEEREVLELLISASRRLDPVFTRQADANFADHRKLIDALPEKARENAARYYDIQYGPWERQHGWRPYLEGAGPRPDGAGFYPESVSRESFQAFIDQNPGQKEQLTSLTTMVVEQDGKLTAVPYSEFFAEQLKPAADELRQAAGKTDDETLRVFLQALAHGLLTDEYRAADMAWMDLDGRIELTYGPYEVYEDELFSYKAAFESYVTLVDNEESKRLARFKQLLPDLERNLPIGDSHKNFDRGTESPIRVVDLVYSAGDARAGIQSIAFNLPNDEAVREAKGSKKVLLRNVLAAKYREILLPIARSVMVPEQVPLVSEKEFVDFVLLHELSHGLGPGRIEVDGKTAEVREFLLEHYNVFEEAKADVVGLWNLLYLIERGEMPDTDVQRALATYVAGLFRSANFGQASAHGQGAMIQFSLLEELGAIEIDPDTKRVRANFDSLPDAIREISRRLLMLQALGDYEAAGKLRAARGKPAASMQALLDGLEGVPVDIRPVYPANGESPG